MNFDPMDELQLSDDGAARTRAIAYLRESEKAARVPNPSDAILRLRLLEAQNKIRAPFRRHSLA